MPMRRTIFLAFLVVFLSGCNATIANGIVQGLNDNLHRNDPSYYQQQQLEIQREQLNLQRQQVNAQRFDTHIDTNRLNTPVQTHCYRMGNDVYCNSY